MSMVLIFARRRLCTGRLPGGAVSFEHPLSRDTIQLNAVISGVRRFACLPQAGVTKDLN
jgi:hypothetical protein